MKKEYAEDCNYWKSGTSSPDSWLDKTIDLIKKFDAQITSSGFGSSGGKSAFMIQFKLEEVDYRIVWPVLKSKTGNELAARRQAVTMLYHDVKAKLIAAQIIGSKASFFAWLCLPNGKVASELNNSELMDNAPKFLTCDVEDTRETNK